MVRFAKALAAAAALVFGLSGCGTLQSAFDYAGGNSDTAIVEFPEPIRLLGLDGRKAGLPLLLKFPYVATISAGSHTMRFQYGETWGVGDANELVRGPIMELAFEAQRGALYRLDFERPTSLRDRGKAEAYVDNFRAWLVDEQGQRVEAESTGEFGGLGSRLVGGLSD